MFEEFQGFRMVSRTFRQCRVINNTRWIPDLYGLDGFNHRDVDVDALEGIHNIR